MLASVAAGLVVAVHMGYLAYMVFGGLLALRWFAWIWPHMVATVWAAYVTLTGSTCPLTTLEKWLLERGGAVPYEGSFIGHYLRGTLYPAGYETVACLCAIGLALATYVVALRRRGRLAVP
ncbi:DUF2784 domain-containing protein [Blastococcus deserti]|uniref:DUF2784 domain-containing protein n=1 Tax=Blastococcus deserti TaxID=2259033 RepID=A0ABW4XB37_9ACTN